MDFNHQHIAMIRESVRRTLPRLPAENSVLIREGMAYMGGINLSGGGLTLEEWRSVLPFEHYFEMRSGINTTN